MLILLLACNPKLDEGALPYCEAAETSVGLEEPTPAGFTPAEVLAFAEGSFEDTLYWDTGGNTPLHLPVSRSGDPIWVDLTAVYPEGTSPAIGVLCDDYLSIPATIGFATDDGAFAESFVAELQAVDATRASFSLDLVADPLQGSFDPAAVPTSDYDELYLSAVGSLTQGGTTGEIAGSTFKDEGCDGDTCSASSEALHVATWGGDAG